MNPYKKKRTTIPPVSFIEHRDHLTIGDKLVKVLSIVEWPQEFIEGFFATMIMDNHYYIDIVTEHTREDQATLLKREMHDLEDKLRHTTDPSYQEELRQKIRTLDQFIQINVTTKNATLNVIAQIYVKADTKEELNEYYKDLKTKLGGNALGVKLRTVNCIQQSLYKKNSSLFIDHGLRAETEFNDGTYMSSLSFCGLWPWIFDTLEDPYGTLLGSELITGGKIILDQFLYENNKDEAKIQGRPNGNMIVVGQSGTGKTTTMSLLVINHVVNHRKIIWIDPENKNKILCDYVGGNYIALGRSDSMINIFDLKPIDTDDDEPNTDEVMYDVKTAIDNVTSDIKITFKLLWPNLSDDAMAMIGEVVVETYKQVGIVDGLFKHKTAEQMPTFTNFTGVIKELLIKKSKKIEENVKEIAALKELEMRMRDITGYDNIEGPYGRYFNGQTTINAKSLNETGMIAIGTKYLFSVEDKLKNALLRMVFQYAWSLCLGHAEEETVFVNDEQHMFISEIELAKVLEIFQRRARKYKTVTLYGTQEVGDYIKKDTLDSGKAIFSNASHKLYMQLEKTGVKALGELADLNQAEISRIMNFQPRQGLLVAGKKHIAIEVFATKEELDLMN